jgi:S-adenosylmethionine hydrolase
VAQRVEGKIVSITADGSLVTDISAEQLRGAPRDERVSIRCDEHMTQGLFASRDDQPPATFLALLGSDGLLTLAVVGESARDLLGLRVGEAVVVEW